MKKHILTAAIAAASITGFSGAAMAWNPTNTPDLQINMSGATAMDNSITFLFSNLCDAGTLDTYYNTSANPGNAYRAFFCTLSPAKVPGLSASKKVLFVKRSAGGSAQGVNPLIDQQRLDALNIFNNNCTETAAGSKVWNCTINQPGDLQKRYSDIGISDVDPAMFRGVNTPAGFNPVNPESVKDLEIKAVAALVFGVPVTNNLYNALQTVQKAKGEIPNDCAIGEYARQECMPTMSKHQVASLISGQIKTWSEFRIDGTPLTSYPGVTAPADLKVRYCKRVNGSGTGAQQYAKFLHNPCTPNALSPMQSSNAFTGPIVHQNSGSGDVDLCLNDFATGSNQSGFNNINVGNKTAWALGVQSMEKNANNQWAYKFVKVDGVAPTLKNAFNGKYFDWVEMTYQWLRPSAPKLPSCVGEHLDTCGPSSPAGDTLKIIEKMVVDGSAPATVASIMNGASNYPFGKSGYLAVASNGHPYSDVLNENAPVIPYSHAAGVTLDNCTVPVIKSSTSSKPLL